VRVSPERADDLRRALSVGDRADGGPVVRVDADPGLSPSTCVMQSEFGNVELGIEAQLRALREGLESVWGDEPRDGPPPRQDPTP
jgi:type III secretion protein L